MFVRTKDVAALPVLFAVTLALALSGCGDTVGPSPVEPSAGTAFAAAQVYSYGATLQGTAQLPLGDAVTACLAEPVEVHYNDRLRVMLAQMSNGERSLASVQMTNMGDWAMGTATGSVYRVVGTSIDLSLDGAGGYGNGASTWTTSGRQQYVGPNGRAFTVRTSYGIAVTPDGTLAAERLTSALECR